MKKWFALLTLAFFVSNIGLSQSEKRLKKLYSKKKVDKCYIKSKKLIQKNRSNAWAHLHLSKSTFQIYLSQKTKSRKVVYLKETIREYALAEKYGRRDRQFYLDTLLPAIEHLGTKYLLKSDTNTALKIGKYLLKLTGDTALFYTLLLLPQTTPKIVEDTAPITNEDSLRNLIIAWGKKLQGIPYQYGGESESGFDCSGFTKYVYAKVGIELPHNANQQSRLGEHKTLDNSKPGDLVFFGYKNGNDYRAIHAGIIYKNEESDTAVVHCVTRGVAIEGKDSSWDRYWKNKTLFVTDLLSVK